MELPAHYYQYKGKFARCAAIQIVFEYFPLKDLMKSQHVSKRFYKRIFQWVCPRVPVPLVTQSYTDLMKQQTARVMVFRS